MKFITTIFLLSAVLNSVICQDQVTYPEIEFNNLVPNWVYVTTDTNYVIDFENNSLATTYSNRLPNWLHEYDGSIYIFEQGIGPQSGLTGFGLSKIDPETGMCDYTFFDNFNTGLKVNEVYMNSSFDFSEERLKIYGYRALDSVPTASGLFFYSRPISKSIDLSDGFLASEEIGSLAVELNITNFNGIGLGSIFQRKNKSLFHIQNSGSIIDSFAYNEMYIHRIDDSLNIIQDFHKRISFNTEYFTNELSVITKPLYEIVNDSTFVVLNLNKNLMNLEDSPIKASLSWWSFDELDSITLKTEIDITEEFYSTREFLENLSLSVIDDDVIITQHISNDDNEELSFSWLSWFNEDGQKMNSVIKSSSSTEDVGNIKALAIIDEQLVIQVPD